jgi:AmmeMemoRadiSam system protein A
MALSAVFTVPHPPLLVPEVGKGEEKVIQSTFQAMEKVAHRIKDIAPDTIIVLSPHAPFFHDRFVLSSNTTLSGDLRRFGAPKVALRKEVDLELSTKIYAEAIRKAVPILLSDDTDFFIDHGVLVPLSFVEKVYTDYRLIEISLSSLPLQEHYSFGKCIAKAINDTNQKVVLIASGDLSHRLTLDGPYGFSESGPVFDQILTRLLKESRLDEIMEIDPAISEAAAECGLRSFVIMAGVLTNRHYTADFMSYEGPFGVGYAVCGFEIIDAEEDTYVALARQSLEHYVRNGKVLDRPSGLPDDLLKNAAGVFVSLKKDGRLRGCIGTISAVTECIADEIIGNAVESGAQDPRFPPVEEVELPDLVYSVDVLGKPEPITDKSELDPIRYGVIVSYGGRRGLLLPNLEGVDTVEDQLKIALQKAGIASSSHYSIERFEVIRHK